MAAAVFTRDLGLENVLLDGNAMFNVRQVNHVRAFSAAFS
jgi:hypothetical protein